MKAFTAVVVTLFVLGCIGSQEESAKKPEYNSSDDDEFIKEYVEKQLSVNNKTKDTTTSSTSTTTSSSTTTTTIYDFNVTDEAIKAFRGSHKPPTTTTSSTMPVTTTTTTLPCLSHCSEIRYPSPDNCKIGCCYTTGDRCVYSPGNLKAGGGPKCRCV